MYFIGVDLGTSAVKLLLMEDSGKICNIVQKNIHYFSHIHAGLTETGRLVCTEHGRYERTDKGIDRTQVAGIGFGGQMHGLVTLDKDDNVIRPAILWNDGRTARKQSI